MFAHERYKVISELVARKQRVTVGALQKALRISQATLRRDLAEMEKLGAIVRVHGGVVSPQSLQGEASFVHKLHDCVEAKREIAKAAADLVEEGASVFLDSGTTCLEIGRRLIARGKVTLITNSVPLLSEAYKCGAPICSIGGELRAISGALTGAAALAWMEQFQADWAFLGSSGLDAESVATTEINEAAIKRQFIANSRRAVLAADGSKWNRVAPVRFARWEDFECWITSGDIPAAGLAGVKKAGVKVVRCKA